MMTPMTARGRTPVKLHKQVSLIVTQDPLIAAELLARKPLARRIVGRLSETALLIHPDDETAVLDELKRMGHTPRVVD